METLYKFMISNFQDVVVHALPPAREPETEEKPQKTLNEKQQVSSFNTGRSCNLQNHHGSGASRDIFVTFILTCIKSDIFYILVQENQDLLIMCISEDLGFSGGKPVAACLIFKCLLHWRSFEVDRTNVFDRIIQTIGGAIEVSENLLI